MPYIGFSEEEHELHIPMSELTLVSVRLPMLDSWEVAQIAGLMVILEDYDYVAQGWGFVFTKQNSIGFEQLMFYSSNDVRYVEQGDRHGACNMHRKEEVIK